jgi:predicted ABC-type ATPase
MLQSGYRVQLIFLALLSAEIAVARVAERVRQGGHSVPEIVIRRRFSAGLRNLFTLYMPIVSAWQVFDNSGIGPRSVARSSRDRGVEVLDDSFWRSLTEMGR